MRIEDPAGLVDLQRYPITSPASAGYRDLMAACRAQLDERGACELESFLTAEAVGRLVAEALMLAPLAHHSQSRATAYLEPPDEARPEGHPRRFIRRSSVGAVAYDLFPAASLIRRLYEWETLRAFLGDALGRTPLYPYADPFGALNLAVMTEGEQLAWHFDMTDFVVSLALVTAERGGNFEFVPHIRNAHDECYGEVERLLHGDRAGVVTVAMQPGTLLLFEGRYAIHQVTPVEGPTDRLVALLAYDTNAGTMSSPGLRRARYGRDA